MSVRRWSIVAVSSLVAVVALLVVGAGVLQSAQQQVPGSRLPGTVAPGATAVSIANEPTVQARQTGEWQVSVPGGVTLKEPVRLTLPGPEFVRVGTRYTMRWATGLSGTYTIERLSSGWALGRTNQGSRLWVNTALAVVIEEER